MLTLLSCCYVYANAALQSYSVSLFVLTPHNCSMNSSSPCNKLCPSSASSEPACLLRHIVTSKPPASLRWGLFQVGKTHSRHALLSRLPKYPPSMLYPKAQFPLPPSYLVCRLDDLCPVGNLCIVALTKGPGACLNSLGVMLQINKDATMLPFRSMRLSFPIRLMQFPYLLSGDVILFQLDSPLPSLARALSLH